VRPLDRAIFDGVQQALDGGLKLIASLQNSIHDIPFQAVLVSLTSIEIRGANASRSSPPASTAARSRDRPAPSSPTRRKARIRAIVRR
jgi:hypothetical protein